MNYTNSPIEQIIFNEEKYFIKRDDLLHKDFSGNKARKFYYPKGQTITYDQHGNIVGTKIFNNVPVGKIKLSDQNVFTFLYKKYC